MPKTLPATMIAATSLITFSAFAQDNTSTSTDTSVQGKYQPEQAVGSGNGFIDANVGRTNGLDNQHFGSLSGLDFAHGQRGRRTGYGLGGGYRWKAGPDLGLGVEAGYADLGDFRVSNLFHSQPVNQTSSVNALHGWLLGVNGRLSLVQGWYLSAHGGYFHANDYNHIYPYNAGSNPGTLTAMRAATAGMQASVPAVTSTNMSASGCSTTTSMPMRARSPIRSTAPSWRI